MFGYPANVLNNKYGGSRNFEFSPGFVTSRLNDHPRGYTLRYNALTRGGMSGGPVFDSEGRVIAIHGEGDRDYDTVADEQGNPNGRVATKTGFNAAIPINIFITKLSEAGLRAAAIASDDSPITNTPVAVNNSHSAQTFYVRGLSRFDQGDFSGATILLRQFKVRQITQKLSLIAVPLILSQINLPKVWWIIIEQLRLILVM